MATKGGKGRGRQRAVRANGQATQARLLEEAEALFSCDGYEATSLRQIAAAAEVDVATLKYHFRDKAALFGEVYRRGHGRFMEALEPILEGLGAVDSPQALRAVLDDFVVALHDFIEANLPFVRLCLYRMLEERAEVISVEEELQALAIAQVDQKLRALITGGIIRQVDTRALIVFLVASLSSWQTVGRLRGHWLGNPRLDTPHGRSRSERFVIDLLERYLLEAGE